MKDTVRSIVKKNKNLVLSLLMMTVALMVILGGCQLLMSGDEGNTVNEQENLIVVGVSQLGSESGWRTANTESVQRVFTKENGYFLIFNNARQKQENQIKAVRSFISQRVDYIVISPVVETGWEIVLEEAKEAGVPVILMDRGVNVSDKNLYVTQVGSDFVGEGKKAACWLEQYLKEEGREEEPINIVMLKGTQGSSAQIGRTTGFNTVSGKHPNWGIIDQEYGDFTSAKGKEVMEQFLEKYDDIDVVVSQNDDMTMGALEAIREAGKTTGEDGDIIVISFDAVREALELVQQGIINVDVECNPDQGEYISDIIDRLETGQQIDKKYYVEENIFTQENVTEELLQDREY